MDGIERKNSYIVAFLGVEGGQDLDFFQFTFFRYVIIGSNEAAAAILKLSWIPHVLHNGTFEYRRKNERTCLKVMTIRLLSFSKESALSNLCIAFTTFLGNREYAKE